MRRRDGFERMVKLLERWVTLTESHVPLETTIMTGEQLLLESKQLLAALAKLKQGGGDDGANQVQHLRDGQEELHATADSKGPRS